MTLVVYNATSQVAIRSVHLLGLPFVIACSRPSQQGFILFCEFARNMALMPFALSASGKPEIQRLGPLPCHGSLQEPFCSRTTGLWLSAPLDMSDFTVVVRPALWVGRDGSALAPRTMRHSGGQESRVESLRYHGHMRGPFKVDVRFLT